MTTLRITFINVPNDWPATGSTLVVSNVILSNLRDGCLFLQHQLDDGTVNYVAYPLTNIFSWNSIMDADK